MPLIFYGKTKCKICQKPIDKGGKFYSFSPFISNDFDPLVIFNDSVVHEECGKDNPLLQKALQRYQFITNHNSPPKCFISNELIVSPNGMFVLGFLTEDKNHPLYPYNCIYILEKNFVSWPENRWLIQQLEEYDASGLWGGDALKRLIIQLKKVLDT